MLVTTQITFRIMTAVLMLIGLSQLVLGETHTKITDGSTPPSVALSPASGNPKIEDYGSIGSFNGRLNYTIPLLNMGGRGESGYTIPLGINSLWIFDYTVFYAHDFDGNDTYPISENSFPYFLGDTVPKYMPGKLVPSFVFSPSPPCSVGTTNYYLSKLT